MSNNWITKSAINGVELEQIIKAKAILETFGYEEFISFRKMTIIDWYVTATGANGNLVHLVVDTLDDDIRYATDDDFDNTYE